MRRRAVSALALSALLTACGGGGGGSATAPQPVSNGMTQQIGTGVTGTLKLTVANGTGVSANKRAPKFVSGGAKSAGVSVGGEQVQYVDVSTSSPLCTTAQNVRTCTILVGAPAGQTSFNVSLYDAAMGGGHLLSSGSTTATIVAGQTFSVPIAMNAAVATVISSTNTTFTSGTAGSVTFAPVFADAAAQAITGTTPFLYPISITFNTTHVTSSPATVTAPGQQITFTYDGSTSLPSTVTATVMANGVSVFVGTVPVNSNTAIAVTRCNFSPQTQGSNIPAQITVGPDGKIWWAETVTNSIGRIDPAVGCSSMTHFPNATGVGAPLGIAAGGDGNIWYSTGNVKLGRMSTSGGAPSTGSTSITVSGAGGTTGRLAVDSQGNVWYINYASTFSQVAYVDKTTFAVNTFGSTPTPNALKSLSALVLGPDNAMWATEPFTSPTSQLVRVTTPANGTAGTMVESDILNTTGAIGINSVYPFDMAAGPDGNIWLPLFASNAMNQFYAKFAPSPTPVTSFTQYLNLIDPNAFANLVTMFKGGDGNMWIAEGGGAVKIPIATPNAPVVEFFTDNGQTTMQSCTAGPDGNNWCTVYGSPPLGQGFINTYDGVIYWTPH
jgi:streptogramin lyase